MTGQRQMTGWRIAGWVILAHGLVILGLWIGPWIRGLFRQPPPVIIPVELTMPAPQPPPPPEPDPIPPPAEPDPAPVAETPTPVAPTNRPPPIEPPPRQRPEIQVSQEWVERTPEPPASPAEPQPTLTPEQLRDLLADTLSAAAPTTPATPSDARDLELIRQTLHRAWQQPSGQHLRGRVTEVSLNLNDQGAIRDYRILRSSGDPAMDQSVREAMERVQRVPGLSAGFAARRSPVTIYFEVD